jgi:hypothetical protein
VLAGAGDEQVPSGGIITGIGRVHGRLVAFAGEGADLQLMYAMLLDMPSCCMTADASQMHDTWHCSC